MPQRLGDKREMPDVPKLDFVGALAEIWSQISDAAYHLAYVRVYSDSAALRTKPEELREQDQAARDRVQVDVTICRAHLAAFFWNLEHVFEALRTAIKHGQKEYPVTQYFWAYEKRLDQLEQHPIRQEIKEYRNMNHQSPGVIGCNWNNEEQLLNHFLPTISGQQQKEDIEMNSQLQKYFEFTAKVWTDFAPGDFKRKFPRDFRFPVTVPHTYLGQLPEGLRAIPQLEVVVQAAEPERADAQEKAATGKPGAAENSKELTGHP